MILLLAQGIAMISGWIALFYAWMFKDALVLLIAAVLLAGSGLSVHISQQNRKEN